MLRMKVLIYYNINNLAPIGGPSGYLYGLKQSLKELNDTDIVIDFLQGNKSNNKIKKNLVNHKVLTKLLKVYRSINKIKTINKILTRQEVANLDLNQYDIIHFHTTKDYYCLRSELEKYKGKIVLTSHSPQPLSEEYIDSLTKIESIFIGKKIKNLIKMDEFAFENADYIFFPCEFADEPYIHAWRTYQLIKDKRINNYRYILTGTKRATIETSRDKIRKQYNIPEEAFVISYVGRHNKIKGYDRLKLIASEVLQRYPDSYFLVAGREEPLKGLNHPRWIEVGFTNEPHSFVNASDLFVLPNRETYFDLVMLEVLSIGKYSLISNTGGNKFFHKYSDVGIEFFDTEEEAISKIENIYRMKKETKQKKEEMNKRIFEENFTTEIFARNYIELMKTI